MEKKKNTVEWGGQAWAVAEFGRQDLFEFEDYIFLRRCQKIIKAKMECPALGIDAFAASLAEVACEPITTVKMYREADVNSNTFWIIERAIRAGGVGQWEKLIAIDDGRILFDLAGLWEFVRAALPIFRKKGKSGDPPDPTPAANPTSTSTS